MLSRTVRIAAVLLAANVAAGKAQTTKDTLFGVQGSFVAAGSTVIATYYGWEATTVFGHQIYAMTLSDYNTDLADGCFAFYSIYRTNCTGSGTQDLGGLLGLDLFGKPYGQSCPDPNQACFGNPVSVAFGWDPGTEIIFALGVDQGVDGSLGTNDYNWFFTGDLLRNGIVDRGWPAPGDPQLSGYSHLAYFPASGPGVQGNDGFGIVPGTTGVSLYGWEDVPYSSSDWDFNNAIFSVEGDPNGVTIEVVPEPATLALFGGGLAALGGMVSSRRRRKAPGA